MPTRFRVRWIPCVATTIVIAIGLSLGQWQMRRAAEKEAIEAKLTMRGVDAPVVLNGSQLDLDSVEYRRVLADGEYVREWPVYLDNRPHNGVAGFYLLMPFKLAGSDTHVLIARGWMPRDPINRSKIPATPTPSGMVRIEGIARRNPGHVMQLGTADAIRPNAILQNLNIADFALASKKKMLPLLIEQSNDGQDGLVRTWPRPSTGIEKHYGYAFQWYALAATALLFFVVTGFRRESK